jgi:hypothetical protein
MTVTATRARQIGDALTARREERAALEAEIGRLTAEKQEAVEKEARVSPGRLSALFSAGGTAEQLEKRKRTAEIRLENAKLEIAALERVAVEANQEHAAEQIEEFRRRAEANRQVNALAGSASASSTESSCAATRTASFATSRPDGRARRPPPVARCHGRLGAGGEPVPWEESY